MSSLSARSRSLRSSLVALGIFVCGAGGAAAVTGVAFTAPEVEVRLVSGWATAPTAATDARLGVAFALAPGWHVYWRNSGDAGYPPEIALASDGTPLAATLGFPFPQRFDVAGGLVAFGYEGEMIYPLAAVLPASRATTRLSGELDFVVCELDCVPYSTRLELALPRGDGVVDRAVADLLDRWSAAVPLPAGETLGPVRAELQPSGLLLELPDAPASLADGELFFAPQEWLSLGRPVGEARPGGGVRFRVPADRRDQTRALPVTLLLTAVVGGPGLAQPRELVLTVTAAAGVLPALAADELPGAVSRRPAVALAGLLALAVGAALWSLTTPRPGAAGGDALPAPRVVVGLALLAAGCGLLYLLAERVSRETMAWVELALLGSGLASWLAGRSQRRRAAWQLVAVAALLLAVWLADRGDLASALLSAQSAQPA